MSKIRYRCIRNRIAKRTVHDIGIRTPHFCTLRLFQFLVPLRVDYLSHPHAHPQRRTVRSDRLLASWRPMLSLSRSGVAWSAPCQTRWSPRWTTLREFTCPLSQKCASSVNQRWSRTVGCFVNHCAIFTRMLLSSGVSFWRTCILYGWRRRSLRRIAFSEVHSFQSETLSPVPYRPLRAIQGRLLHACQRASFERTERGLPLPCFLRNNLSPRNSLALLLMVALFGARWTFLWSRPSFLASSWRVWSNDLLEIYVSTQNAPSTSERITNAFLLHSSILPCFNLWTWQVSKKSAHALWKASQNGEYLFLDTLIL